MTSFENPIAFISNTNSVVFSPFSANQVRQHRDTVKKEYIPKKGHHHHLLHHHVVVVGRQIALDGEQCQGK